MSTEFNQSSSEESVNLNLGLYNSNLVNSSDVSQPNSNLSKQKNCELPDLLVKEGEVLKDEIILKKEDNIEETKDLKPSKDIISDQILESTGSTTSKEDTEVVSTKEDISAPKEVSNTVSLKEDAKNLSSSKVGVNHPNQVHKDEITLIKSHNSDLDQVNCSKVVQEIAKLTISEGGDSGMNTEFINTIKSEATKIDSKPLTEEENSMELSDDTRNLLSSVISGSNQSASQTKGDVEESKKPSDAMLLNKNVSDDELGMTEEEAIAYLKEEEAAKKAAAGSGPPKIQIYGSSVSGNFKIKKAQNKILDTLERFNIEYEFMDLAADEEARLYIRRKNPTSTAIPQIYINGEFSMEFEEFEELLEYDELFDALGVEPDF